MLTREQFDKLRTKGLTVEQIVKFEKGEIPEKKTFLQDIGEDIKQTGQTIKKTYQNTKEKINNIGSANVAGEQGYTRSFSQAAGTIAGGISSGIGDIAMGGIKMVLPRKQEEKAKQALGTAISALAPVAAKVDEALGRPVGTFIENYRNLDEKAKRDVNSLFGVSSLAFDLATAGTTKKVGEIGIKKTVDIAKQTVGIAKQTVGKVEDVAEYIKQTVPELSEKAIKLLASEPDEKVKTILKNSSAKKLNEYLDIAKKHSISQEAISGFEKAGELMAETAKKINNLLSSWGKQKAKIIQKAKIGLVEFKDAPRKAILEVMKLEDNSVKKQVIDILKPVKTKLDADKAIDKIQDLIRSNTKIMTIAQGSKFEKQLRGIIGKMNDELKKSLPEAYQSLNAKFSEGKKYLDSLNKGLGEKVGGVSAHGASLIKQFFSPAGAKTKELFAYIKKATRIDLAQEATLAKFAEELFDNPNVRSLLTGIPKSRSGAIDKALDFIVEKTGVGKKLREKMREGTIERAKDFTN